MFWAERDEDRARRSLSNTVYELRQALGDDWISAQPDPLEVSDHVVVDALEFEELVNTGDFAHALSLYHGDFLDGFHIKASNAFDSWLESKRRALKQLYQRAVLQYIDALTSSANTTQAVSVTQRWVSLDPLDDEANHTLIRTLADAGKRAEALAHFDSYARLIKKELDVEPLPRTNELVHALRARRPHPRVNLRGPSPAPVPPAIAVAPSETDYGFLAELKRRGVLRVGWMYLVVVYLVLQGGMMLVDLFTLPKWPVAVLAVIAVLAFPLAIVLSWQFDLTPEGIRATHGAVSIRDRIAGANWRIVGTAFTATASVAVLAALIRPPDNGPIDDVSCASTLGSLCGKPAKMVSDLFVVLPLAEAEGTETTHLSGATSARFLAQGLSHWDGVRVVEQPRLSNALNQLSEDESLHLSLTTGFHIARFLGAGKLVMGNLWQVQDTTHVVALLYDARTQQLLETKSARFPSRNVVYAQSQFNVLAQQLVVGVTGLKVSVGEVASTKSWAAALLYDSAQAELQNWNLEGVKAYLTRALKEDRHYPHANLWLAYAMMWNGDSAMHWRQYSRQAATDTTLGTAETLLAKGVDALARADFRLACEQYRQLLTRDATSFFGWFGLGECLRLDDSVVPDQRSPSGWSFVTSRSEAINAYQRALDLVPNFAQIYWTAGSTPLSRILFTTPGRFRVGVAGSLRFGAWPDLIGDSLSLVPYPFAEWRTSRPPSGELAIIARHQMLISRVATKWAESFPNDPRALLGLARVLEQQDMIAPSPRAKYSALGLVGRAKRYAKDNTTAVRAAATEVRLLVKTAKFRDARRRGVAALKKYDDVTGTNALQLAGIAGLIGRPHQMAEFLIAAVDSIDYDAPIAGGGDFQIPSTYARVVLPLLAYASVGAPADSFRSVLARAHEALRLFVPIDQRAAVHAATLDRVERMLFVSTGPHDVHAMEIVSVSGTASWHYLPTLQGLLARGDTGAVKRALFEIEDFRKDKAAIDYSADLLLTRAELALAVGDTAGAIRTIEPYLNDMHHLRADQFSQQWQPAANVRLMIMRAELAARSGQRTVARKWATAAYELWRGADRELNRQLERLRYIKDL